MNSKSTLYRVYTRKGEYHHCYNGYLDGALGWAIECAKRVNGSVVKIEGEKEVTIFNCDTHVPTH